MQTTQLDETLILETLRQVVDPEIDCNIVDLGLIYGTRIEGRKVTVKMTLTTPEPRMSPSRVMSGNSSVCAAAQMRASNGSRVKRSSSARNTCSAALGWYPRIGKRRASLPPAG